MLTIPNIITMLRVLLIPVFLLVYYMESEWVGLGPHWGIHFGAAFIFWFAAVSDALDGYLARKLQQSTPFGAFLDPVADKIMVTAGFFVIVEYYDSAWITVPAVAMVSREIIMSGLREWMSQLGVRDVVAVSNSGKAKTVAQMLSLNALIWDFNYILTGLAYLYLYLAFALTMWSLYEYFSAAWPHLVGAHSKEQGEDSK
ncbi:MAG: CDP-diacylglycerol--glycerol-3-phosphate 3-phosphatidyltransferase [Phenylobacterium sp.]|jgi:CDP-diacylglycerol--glycerol-3-phosphate 3-phosphatidyltransferase